VDVDASDRRDRAAGSVLGLAWGDALGIPIEGWTDERIREHYGEYAVLPHRYPDSVRALDAAQRAWLRPLGIHSDDTQQALALVSVVLEHWSPRRWADLLVAGEEAGAWRGTGPNFGAALRKLRDGVPPTRSGSHSAGIGAAMRSGPLGALLWDDPATLRRVAFESACVTHADVRAIATAYAAAWSVARLVAGDDAGDVLARLPDEVADAEASWLEPTPDGWGVSGHDEPPISTLLRLVTEEEAADAPALAAAVVAAAREHVHDRVDLHPNHGYAPLGGVHAIVTALLFDDPPAAVLGALVRAGGDTDTVGAIAGTILGARHGAAWIPSERLLDAERLHRYAGAVAERAAPPEDRATFLERERQLTTREEAFRRDAAS
jgi:ADP-ribosyl-[dinitrogen reductase] hydrolase